MDKDEFDREVTKDALKFSKNRLSAINHERAMESNDFSEEAQENFGANERGAEDLIDMYEKGAFDS